MRHSFLDRHSRLDSSIHRIPAGIKLILSLILIVTLVTTPSWPAFVFAGAAVGLVVISIASKVPPLFLFTRLLIFEPVIFGIAVLRLFGPNGWESFATILMKSTLCLLTMILLTNTTPFERILALLKRLHIPPIFVTILALMYRYLFVLIDEAERMQRARRSRTFDKKRVRSWKMLGDLVGQLFIRSSERAERIYAAMCSRGWV